MSDEADNKLVRQSHEIVPAENFARKIEERLRAEPVPAVEPARECLYAFKYEKGIISRCKKLEPHNEHQNGIAFWKDVCNAASPDGEPCVYQLEHVGDHGNGRDATWAQQAIAQVGAPFTKSRQYSFGFGPEKVPPGTTRTVTVRPQIYFRGEKLLVSDPELTIVSFFVGSRKQSIDNVSAAFFSPSSLGSGLRIDTAQPAIDISIVVANYTNVERTFSAELIGRGVGA